MGSTNPLLKIDGFGRTHRTHANAAPEFGQNVFEGLKYLPHFDRLIKISTLVYQIIVQDGIKRAGWKNSPILRNFRMFFCVG